jgi:hypothetical protein
LRTIWQPNPIPREVPASVWRVSNKFDKREASEKCGAENYGQGEVLLHRKQLSHPKQCHRSLE